MLKRRETILFGLFAIGIFLFTYLELDQTFFLYEIGQWFLYFCYGLTIIYAIYRLFRDTRPLPVWQKARPLIAGAAFAPFFFLLSYLVKTDGGKTNRISARRWNSLTFMSMDLRTDNSFRFLNSGPFGGNIYRGHYTLSKDTLRVDNKELSFICPSLTFVLKRGKEEKSYFEPANDSMAFLYRLYVYDDGQPPGIGR